MTYKMSMIMINMRFLFILNVKCNSLCERLDIYWKLIKELTVSLLTALKKIESGENWRKVIDDWELYNGWLFIGLNVVAVNEYSYFKIFYKL